MKHVSCLAMLLWLSSLQLHAIEYTVSGNNLWVPEKIISEGRPVRCILSTANTGQGKNFYSHAEFRALAEKWDMVLIYANTASTSYLCNWLAEEIGHPELTGAGSQYEGGSLPVVWCGVSVSGQFAISRARNTSDCAVAALGWRARFYNPFAEGAPDPPEDIPAVQGIPVLSAMSFSDDKEDRSGTIETNLRDGARDYHHAEWTGFMQYTSAHSQSGDLYFAALWLDAVMAQRMPTGAFDATTKSFKSTGDRSCRKRGFIHIQWKP